MPDSTGMGAVVRRAVTHTMTKGRFAGRTFEFMALGIRDIVQCQEECLEDRKREFLQTYTRNMDLIPRQEQAAMLREAFSTAGEMQYSQLPKQIVEMPLIEDGKQINDPDTGLPVLIPTRVEYAMWWVGETLRGKLYSAWLAMRKCQGQGDITINDVDDIFVDSIGDLDQAVGKLGRATNPRVLGNEDAPAAAGEPPARETPRQRRARQREEKKRTEFLTGR